MLREYRKWLENRLKKSMKLQYMKLASLLCFSFFFYYATGFRHIPFPLRKTAVLTFVPKRSPIDWSQGEFPAVGEDGKGLCERLWPTERLHPKMATEMGAGGKIPNNANVMPSSKKPRRTIQGPTYRVISLDLVPGKVTEQDLRKRKSTVVLSRQLRVGKN